MAYFRRDRINDTMSREVRATANKRPNLHVLSPDDIKKSQQA